MNEEVSTQQDEATIRLVSGAAGTNRAAPLYRWCQRPAQKFRGEEAFEPTEGRPPRARWDQTVSQTTCKQAAAVQSF